MLKADMISGEDFELRFEFFTEGATSSPNDDVVKDITGYTARAEMRLSSTGGKVLTTWIDGSPNMTRNDPAGTIVLTIPHDVTPPYDFSVAYIDILLSGPNDGVRSDAIEVTLDRGVTKWPL